jgi:HD-GYP domain-containing protein (c-di-GMP phosphodiesterase class II)
LYANSPLTEEKRDFLIFVKAKGGEVSIQIDQKTTFLQATELKEEDVPDLKDEGPNILEIKAAECKKAFEKEQQTGGKLRFNMELKSINETDDYSNIIKHTRMEVMTFSPRISHTVSMAVYLAEHYLIEDNFINRIVALSFQMAKSCRYEDEESLGDLFVASYFAHLGHTQLNLDITRTPFLELPEKRRKEYKKHPGLSHHLIRKSGIDLSERCIKIINEHHERYDGSGYPSNRTGTHIEPLALVLGVSIHLLEFTSGKVAVGKRSLKAMIHLMKNRSFTPGLEFEFGETIAQNLEFMFGENLDMLDIAA